ncbi:hypothetical protein HYV50_03315 [Candidatus Pacearchaeota archaeon]|nr:hypothetical protein [Candidatus Pacearchaeota archaeon]
MSLRNFLDDAQESLFRFESLQYYEIEEEKEFFQDYLKTGKIDIVVLKNWHEFITRKMSQGVIMERIRLVNLPLTDYTKCEIMVYLENIKHGEDIRIITEKEFNSFDIEQKDFWLTDDKIVIKMNYNLKGEYLGSDLAFDNDIKKYVNYKKLLINNSVLCKRFCKTKHLK